MTSEFDVVSFCFIGISLLSLRILSFHNSTSLLFINKCVVLHVTFPERDAEIRVLSCYTLPLPAQAVDRIYFLILYQIYSLGTIDAFPDDFYFFGLIWISGFELVARIGIL